MITVSRVEWRETWGESSLDCEPCFIVAEGAPDHWRFSGRYQFEVNYGRLEPTPELNSKANQLCAQVRSPVTFESLETPVQFRNPAPQ